MKEQSHKDEMSRALRGDFERLRGRGVSTTLAPPDDDPVSEAADAAVTEEVAAEASSIDEDVPAPGWLGRLLGR